MGCHLYLHPLVISTLQQFLFTLIAGFTSANSLFRHLGLVIFFLCNYVALSFFTDYVEPPGWVARTVASAFPQITLTYFERMIVRKIAYDDGSAVRVSNSKPPSFNQRYKFGNLVATSMRGLDTPWEVKHLHPFSSSDKSYVPSPGIFILRNVLAAVACYLTHRLCITTQLALDQNFMSPSHVPFFRRVGDISLDELKVRYMATVTTVMSIYCFIQGGYSLGSAASVMLDSTAVKGWRPVFGELSEAYCLRQFWAVFWHQGLQNNLRGTANWITTNMLRVKSHSLLSRYLKILLAFFFSGLVHVPSDMGSAVPAAQSGAIQFFCMQPIGLMIEDVFSPLFRPLWRYRAWRIAARPLGYFWVITFLAWSGPVRWFPVIRMQNLETETFGFGAFRPLGKVISFLPLLALCYAGLCIVQLTLNYRKAHKIGLPILITPVDPSNVPWLLCSSWLEPFLRKWLPFGLGNFVDYNSRDWNYDKIHQLQEDIGDTFCIVSPKQVRVFTGNAEAADGLSRRRKDFVKAVALYKPLEIFGRNVVTTEGDDWVRHRRLTTPPFNERNSALVWEESKRQAVDMLHEWENSPDGQVTNPQRDTMMLALHVLTAAGFGRPFTFGKGLETPSDGHSLTYRDALSLILGNLFTAVFTATVNLPSWMLPGKFADIDDAVDNFRRYMIEMVQEERAAMAAGDSERDNLMSILVRASEASRQEGKGARHLSDTEIYGNLFSYNLAGHETTSNTLAYATILLAAHPDWQEWVRDEVDAVTAACGHSVSAKDLQYETAYPQLKRCLALMHETLRLFGAARAVPKTTTISAQTLTINGHEYVIPPNTFIGVNLAGLHTSSASWGKDSLAWRPDRWITRDKKDDTETLAPITTGAFLPWAAGPRVCPGKKFSQVEFVAVLACMLSEYRIEPVTDEKRDKAAAAAALMEELKLSSFNFLLKVKNPDRIKLRCVGRKTGYSG
ncbi:cytochrome p450 3a7 [Rhypophila sp. PSN 637]